MGYYEDIKGSDLLTRMKRLLENGGYFLRDDGKIAAQHRISWDQPWHHVRHHPMLKCHTWHEVLFNVISMGLPREERFVPSNCQNCYKVVVRPKTLTQLFALLDLQKQLDRPSKCGIETRETVPALYGGYFYNLGLESGLECYRAVRAAVDSYPKLGKDVNVLLKRGCTEFEHAIGPSDKWVVTNKQLQIEAILDQILAKDDIDRRQPEYNLRYIHRKWIEWAYFVGDQTYREFTAGPLYPDYVTYQHLANNETKEAQ